MGNISLASFQTEVDRNAFIHQNLWPCLALLCLALSDISTRKTGAREILLIVNVWESKHFEIFEIQSSHMCHLGLE